MASGLPSMPNDAIASYHFAVEIDGVEIAQFAEISGITSEMDVIEFSEVTPDGKSLIYSGAIEDPVYLTRPVEWSGQWLYRPNMPHSNEKCDVEVARKFLDDLK